MTPLQQHIAEWKDCKRCPLHATRNVVVLGKGSVPCDILFVGEAPGKSEDVHGEPFVGPAGHLLDAVIIEAFEYGGKAYTTAFTNVIACIPVVEGVKATEPPKASCKACQPRLVEFVKLCSPRLVVCAGKTAGDWTDPDWKDAAHLNVPRVAVTHPAAVLRAPYAQQPVLRRGMVVGLRDAIRKHLNQAG